MNVIAIANPKGGCGKTTAAVNLAACLGHKGRRVLLVDLDEQGHASLGLGVPAAGLPGMFEVFVGATPLREVIFSDVTGQVDLVPGGATLAAVEQSSMRSAGRGRMLARRLRTVAAYYDDVIVDSPPGFGVLTMNALRAADRVVVPVEPGPYARDGIVRLREVLARLHAEDAPPPRFILLPSRVDRRSRLTQTLLEELTAAWPGHMAPVQIGQSAVVNEAARHGRPLVDHAPRASAAEAFDMLAEWMLGHRVERRARPAHDASGPTMQRVPNFTFSESIGKVEDNRRVVLSYHHLPNKDIKIAGDFNDWIPDHEVETRVVNDTVQKVLRVQPGAYQYRVVIDGKWQEDPVNPVRVPNSAGGSNSLLRVIP